MVQREKYLERIRPFYNLEMIKVIIHINLIDFLLN